MRFKNKMQGSNKYIFKSLTPSERARAHELATRNGFLHKDDWIKVNNRKIRVVIVSRAEYSDNAACSNSQNDNSTSNKPANNNTNVARKSIASPLQQITKVKITAHQNVTKLLSEEPNGQKVNSSQILQYL